ncbi:hypothetical protein LTR95_002913 [Oleoguttula sp. CCFEE 5521]
MEPTPEPGVASPASSALSHSLHLGSVKLTEPEKHMTQELALGTNRTIGAGHDESMRAGVSGSPAEGDKTTATPKPNHSTDTKPN